MSRVTGLALRGPIYSGIPTPGIRCCSTHRGSSLFRSRPSLLHPEHRTSGRQRFELFWSAVDTVELPKKLDPMRHPARELPHSADHHPAALQGHDHRIGELEPSG